MLTWRTISVPNHDAAWDGLLLLAGVLVVAVLAWVFVLVVAPDAKTKQRGNDNKTRPAYIIWVGARQYYLCETLIEALEAKRKYGGLIYEPLGMAIARQLDAEDGLDSDEA